MSIERHNRLALVAAAATDVDDDRICNLCGTGDPESDAEFCRYRQCPYAPQPVAAPPTSNDTASAAANQETENPQQLQTIDRGRVEP